MFPSTSRHMLCSIAVALPLLGCGSKAKPTPPESAGDLTINARPDAIVVAQVNGQPVYGDCVSIQVEHGRAKTAIAALQQCIEFELLAQEAFARGYLSGREMIDLRKQEATRLFIETDFANKFSSPQDVPEQDLRRWYQRAKPRYVHPEFRKVTYVRAEYTKDTPAGSKLDRDARRLIYDIHDALKGERVFAWKLPRYDLTKDAFSFIARRAAGMRHVGVSAQSHSFMRWGPINEQFRAASYAIEHVGEVSPPIRTPWGWDIILLELITPAKNVTFQDAKADLQKFLFQSSRGSAFLRWAEQFISIKTINRIIREQAIDTLKRMQADEDRKNLPQQLGASATDPT